MANRSQIKGRIVLVAFPFDDLSSSKVRPALCLTDTIGRRAHVILAFITSATPPDLLPSDLRLSPSDANFAQTGLRALPSCACIA